MTKQFETDSPTFDEIQAVRKPRTRSEWIPLDGGLLREIEEVEIDLRQAERDDEREHRTPVAPRLREQLDELRARAEQAAVRFTAQALPRKAYRELIEAHPPQPLTKEQVEQKVRQGRWTTETFAPALITACFVEPVGVDGRVIWDEWDAGIAEALFGMALMVNEEPPQVPSGARSTARAAASELSSTTAALEGSPTPTS